MDVEGAIPLDEARWLEQQRRLKERLSPANMRLHHGLVGAISFEGREIPERRWIVDGIIPCRATTLFSGHGASGKSVLGLQLAVATVTGRDWLGYAVQPCPVAVLSCEDDEDEMQRRLSGILEAEGLRFRDLNGLHLFDRSNRDNAILHREGAYRPWEVTPWWSTFCEWAEKEEIGLIICDSLYDFFPASANQLNNGDVHAFMSALNGLARDRDGAVLVLAHPSQSGIRDRTGEAGSVAFHNKARSRLFIEREKSKVDGEDEDTGIRVITRKKSNYGVDTPDVARVEWLAGRFVRVDAPPASAPSGFFAGQAKREAKVVFLACLNAITKQGRTVSACKGSNYAPKIFARLPGGRGTKVAEFERAMEDLFSDGVIEVGAVGRHANRSKKEGIRLTQPKTDGAADPTQDALL
ncbi:MAG TPA: AAA family ATPase [Magnetospirillum sp.]|nr:AAA family ATPase [Magnetospirillum sp.]